MDVYGNEVGRDRRARHNAATSVQPREYRSKLPHEIPSWVPTDAVFFITICCADREVNQLCSPAIASCIFESAEFRVNCGDWFVHLLLLMPDHAHALISFPHDREMRKIVARWKQYVARCAGVRWQRDFFDHRLRGGESYDEKAHYIRMNPVRKGLVSAPDFWPYLWEPQAR